MRGQLAHVEHDDVGAAVVFGGLGGQQGPLQARSGLPRRNRLERGRNFHSFRIDLATEHQ